MEDVRLTGVGARASSAFLAGRGGGPAAARLESVMERRRMRCMVVRGVYVGIGFGKYVGECFW